MTVHDAIAAADALLPGREAPEGQNDPRWQAVIRVADFIETNPEEVWEFAVRWGASSDPDLRMAIATCLMEHLLEQHPNRFTERLEQASLAIPLFAEMVSHCWNFESETSASDTLARMPNRSEHRHVIGRRFESNADADLDDAEYWRQLPVADRVLEVWRLSVEQWRLRGDSPYEPGLHRSTTRIHRR